MGQPVVNFSPATVQRDAPLKGRLSYNPTPLFEYLLGYRFNPWLKLALSYQHQSGVTIQTKALSTFSNNGFSQTSVVQFTSNLSLNALLAKVYFEMPYAVNWKSLSINPYLAVGVGPGWQSWTQTQVNYMRGNATFSSEPIPLRQKISANAVWMVDLGLRMQSTSLANPFSVVMGCKYNQWGQARSIGKMSQQGAHKLALTQPLRIKTVYQFAPYLGVQWNFSPNQTFGTSYKLKGKSPRVWRPYWVASKKFQSSTGIWTQFNAGIGFLYFSGLKANLMGNPFDVFAEDPPNNLLYWRDVPFKGRLSYNRTPLLEYLIGYRFNSCLKLAFSYQHQGGIAIQSKALPGFTDSNRLLGAQSSFVQFTSKLSLDGLLAKVYFELPYAMIWRSLSMNPYLAVGVGGGWQSWTQIRGMYMSGASSLETSAIPYRQKISTNVIWMIDTGLRVQSAYPNSQFSVLLGCKYNQWGQARSMGKMSQQGALKLAFFKPLRIKTVYQFAPYLGVQWNFSPDVSVRSTYKLKGKSPKVWFPYWAASREFQCSTNIWTQFNTGVGFLYFSGLRGNLMRSPFVAADPGTIARDVPLKGRLSYNRTPIFEYLLGYQFNLWLKVALSYQYQGGLTVETKALHAYANVTTTERAQYAQFTSNLMLNALLAKVYFELPFSMIWRSLAINPYIAVGVGPGWQSWTRITAVYMADVLTDAPRGEVLPLHQKISTNAVWMVDTGFRIQSAYPSSHFSVLLGCKYNQWGQATSIGKMSQQGAHKVALVQPVIIKTVYQFAPYLGVQWNF